MVFLKEVSEKVNFEKNLQTTPKKHAQLPSMQKVKYKMMSVEWQIVYTLIRQLHEELSDQPLHYLC